MEEYLQPDDYAGHAEVKSALVSTPTLLATAEHEYTRYGYAVIWSLSDLQLLNTMILNNQVVFVDTI